MPEKVSTVFLRKESKRLAASGEPVIVLPRTDIGYLNLATIVLVRIIYLMLNLICRSFSSQPATDYDQSYNYLSLYILLEHGELSATHVNNHQVKSPLQFSCTGEGAVSVN